MSGVRVREVAVGLAPGGPGGPAGSVVLDVVDDGPADGVPVLCLHGFPEAAWCWDEVRPLLVADGCRVLAPTQRGYSPRARPTAVDAYRLDRLVDDALAVADAAGWDTFHLVGHDWGAVLGWALAADHPARLRSLTVLSVPHPRAFAAAMTRSTQPLRSLYAGFFQLPLVPEASLVALGGAVTRGALRRSGLRPDLVERSVALLTRPGAATGALNWYRAAGRDAATVGTVAVPTTFLWGDADPALGRWGAEHTVDHVAGPYRFEPLAGVGHWIPHDEPELVRDAVAAHVATGLRT